MRNSPTSAANLLLTLLACFLLARGDAFERQGFTPVDRWVQAVAGAHGEDLIVADGTASSFHFLEARSQSTPVAFERHGGDFQSSVAGAGSTSSVADRESEIRSGQRAHSAYRTPSSRALYLLHASYLL